MSLTDADQPTAGPGGSSPSLHPESASPDSDGFLEKSLIAAGFCFCAASAATLAYGVYLVVTTGAGRTQTPTGAPSSLWAFLAGNVDLFALILFSTIAAIIGLSFFKHAGRSTNFVIRPEDRQKIWPLISEPKPEAIDQYIRLASLSGFTGAFTKIGFTGLPLATVGLTLLFVVLALLNQTDIQVTTTLFDMAKLTLGAFIGSFVQKQIAQREEASEDAVAASKRERGLPV
jgi:hypothetical protein